MRRRRVLQRREQTEKRSVAGLELAQAFKKRGKAKRFLQGRAHRGAIAYPEGPRQTEGE